MKYAMNYNNTVNLIVVDPNNMTEISDIIFEVPDEVEQNWLINEGGDIVKPSSCVDVVDNKGDFVSEIVIKPQSIISI